MDLPLSYTFIISLSFHIFCLHIATSDEKVIFMEKVYLKDGNHKKKLSFENIDANKFTSVKYKNSTSSSHASFQSKRILRIRQRRSIATRKIVSSPNKRLNLDWSKIKGNIIQTSSQTGRNVVINRKKRIYTKWTKWEKCSKTCMTQRHRWCKIPKHCGTEMISQAAYCFTEEGTCKAWIHAMIDQGWDFSNTVKTVTRGDYKEHKSRVTVGRNPQAGPECGLVNNTVTNWDLRKIIGGQPARPGHWPWQVALLNRFKEVFCGGTLISESWILTAAHCVQRPLYARFGEYNLAVREPTEATFRIRDVVIHPQYNPDIVDNDIALLKVDTSITAFPHACLPSGGNTGRHGHNKRSCTIIGWGKTNPNHISGTNLLHQAQIPIVSRQTCREVYKEHTITNNMICAGFRNGRRDSCLGDSGGPLLCKDSIGRWSVQGITSFGDGCGRKSKYGIYTKVSNYIYWIRQVMSSS